jgi:hypothetical protein
VLELLLKLGTYWRCSETCLHEVELFEDKEVQCVRQTISVFQPALSLFLNVHEVVCWLEG